MRSRPAIIEATLDIIRDEGFAAVSISAVAQAAGVSRQTVYSNFDSHDNLVSSAIGEAAVDALGVIRNRLENADSVADYLIELIVAGRAVMRDDPVLATLLRADIGNPAFDSAMMDRAMPIAHQLIAPVRDIDPAVEPHVDDIARFCIRLGLSVVVFTDPSISDDDGLRAFLHRWLEPPLDRLLR